MSEHQQNVLSGVICMSCYDPMGGVKGHPRDCAKCKARQLSDKRPCPQCGNTVHGERGMRDHFRQVHSPAKPASEDQLGRLQEKFHG